MILLLENDGKVVSGKKRPLKGRASIQGRSSSPFLGRRGTHAPAWGRAETRLLRVASAFVINNALYIKKSTVLYGFWARQRVEPGASAAKAQLARIRIRLLLGRCPQNLYRTVNFLFCLKYKHPIKPNRRISSSRSCIIPSQMARRYAWHGRQVTVSEWSATQQAGAMSTAAPYRQAPRHGPIRRKRWQRGK